MLDRKFIAQQRNIIFFAPKPMPLIEPLELRDRSPPCDGPDGIGKRRQRIAGGTHLANVRTEEEFHDVIRRASPYVS